MNKVFTGIWTCIWAHKNKIVIGLLLGIAAHISFCSQESRMVLAAQATMQLSQQYNLTEDQQKMLSARLNEIAESNQGFIDRDVAQSIAESIQALPTQAGPAPVSLGEAEEKEEREESEELAGGKKSKPNPGDSQKKLKAKPGTVMISRKVLEAMSQARDAKDGGGQLDPKSKLFEQLGGQIASFEPTIVLPWNIQFAPGEVSKVLKEMGRVGRVRTSLNGCCLAVAYDENSKTNIDVWDMQMLRKIGSVRPNFYLLGGWAISPHGDKLAMNDWYHRQIILFDVRNGKEYKKIPVEIFFGDMSFSSDGNAVVCYSSEEQSIITISVETGKLVSTIAFNEMKSANKVTNSDPGVLSTNSLKLAIPNYLLHDIKVYDSQTKKILHRLKLQERVLVRGSLILDALNNRLGAITMEAESARNEHYFMNVWDLTTGRKLCDVNIPTYPEIPRWVLSPDGRYIAYALIEQGLKVWNLSELERQYAESLKQAGEQEAKVEEESKESENAVAPGAVPPTQIPQAPAVSSASPARAASPAIPVISRRITAAQAMKEFPSTSLPTIRKRSDWAKGLEELAAGSPDRKINYEDAWQLFEDIKK